MGIGRCKAPLPLRLGLAACGLLPGCTGAAAPPGATWTARLEGPDGSPGTSGPVTYRLERDGAGFRLTFDDQGQTRTAGLAAAAGSFLLPLGGRAGIRDSRVPGGSAAAPASPGGTLWDGRPVVVASAAPGVVRQVRAEPGGGPWVEVDHGAGLLTRYGLSGHGWCAVPPGARVAAGERLGVLGAGRPDDIPALRFEVLLETGPGRRVLLDPAPFLLGSAVNRAQPLAASVLNAAVRARDRGQVDRLLDLGLDPNGKAADGTRPLEWAVMVGDAGLVRRLMAAGGDPRAATAERPGTYLLGQGLTIANPGPTILDMALESGDADLAAAAAGH